MNNESEATGAKPQDKAPENQQEQEQKHEQINEQNKTMKDEKVLIEHKEQSENVPAPGLQAQVGNKKTKPKCSECGGEIRYNGQYHEEVCQQCGLVFEVVRPTKQVPLRIYKSDKMVKSTFWNPVDIRLEADEQPRRKTKIVIQVPKRRERKEVTPPAYKTQERREELTRQRLKLADDCLNKPGKYLSDYEGYEVPTELVLAAGGKEGQYTMCKIETFKKVVGKARDRIVSAVDSQVQYHINDRRYLDSVEDEVLSRESYTITEFLPNGTPFQRVIYTGEEKTREIEHYQAYPKPTCKCGVCGAPMDLDSRTATDPIEERLNYRFLCDKGSKPEAVCDECYGKGISRDDLKKWRELCRDHEEDALIVQPDDIEVINHGWNNRQLQCHIKVHSEGVDYVVWMSKYAYLQTMTTEVNKDGVPLVHIPVDVVKRMETLQDYNHRTQAKEIVTETTIPLENMRTIETKEDTKEGKIINVLVDFDLGSRVIRKTLGYNLYCKIVDNVDEDGYITVPEWLLKQEVTVC